QLLLNNRNGTFRNATDRIPQNWPTSSTFGGAGMRVVLPGDFNNDCRLDFLVVGQGLAPTRLYLNAGDARFIDATDYIDLGSGV
ncbi:hypothetical protein EO238_31075, partial [Citrobacter sp. AAK_AS5]